MDKDSKWKDHLLKSGLPLEYEVKQFLDSKGCVSNAEYSYLRQNEHNALTEFSYDIDSSYIKDGFFIDLMIECKYRHDSTKWVFLPEEYGGMDEIEPTSFFNPNDHFTTKNKFIFDSSFPKFPINLGPLCSKGIEIASDGQNPKTISQAIAQLSYAMAEKFFNGMRHQVDPVLKTHFGETLFCNIPVIVTTANLFRFNQNISIDEIRNAENIEDISTKEDILVIKTKPSIELEQHTFSTIQKLIGSHNRNLFKEKLNSFNDDLGFVISAIAQQDAPSCLVVLHHSKDNRGLNKLFSFIDRVIKPDQEIFDLMEAERKRFDEMTKAIDKKIKDKAKNCN